MLISIIIGFRYSGKEELPGITADLYEAYTYAVKNKSDIVFLVTDLEKNESEDNLRKAFNVNEKDIDYINIFSFIEDMSSSPYFMVIRNAGEMNDVLDRIPLQVKYLSLYYTGHGVKVNTTRCMLFPDGSHYSFSRLIHRISSTNLVRHGEIVGVFDCCHMGSLGLRYSFVKDRYVLNESNILCPWPKTLIMTSGNSKDETIASRSGSVFTKKFFQVVSSGIPSVKEIVSLQTIQGQNAKVFSNNGGIRTVPPWYCGCRVIPEPSGLRVYPS